MILMAIPATNRPQHNLNDLIATKQEKNAGLGELN